MSGNECVVLAFFGGRESAQSSVLTVGLEGVAASGQYLVGVGLVTDIEQELVLRRVYHIVHRHDYVYRAEARAEVSRVGR